MRNRSLTFLVLLAAVLFLGTGVAAAHGDEGELSLTRFEQTGPTTVVIEVGIVYENDGDIAEDAQVTATLSGPGGATVGPVALVRTGPATSLYAATTEVPTVGDWAVDVTSTSPTGQVDGTVTVADTTPTSEAAPSTTVADATTATEAPAAVAEPLTIAADGSDEDDGGPSTAVIIGACMVLAVVTIAGAFVIANRRSAEDRDAAGPDIDS